MDRFDEESDGWSAFAPRISDQLETNERDQMSILAPPRGNREPSIWLLGAALVAVAVAMIALAGLLVMLLSDLLADNYEVLSPGLSYWDSVIVAILLNGVIGGRWFSNK